MLKTQLITKIPLEAPVNQCQGFCYDTKRQKFVIATISSDNQTQDIMRVCTDCGTVVYKKRFNDKPRLGHMNTLSYRDDLDVIYTTNATVDGFLLTVLNAETFDIQETIKMPHKVFNVAYDSYWNTFTSIRPFKKNMRLIQEYKCDYLDAKPKYSHEYQLDCFNEDINNNGALSQGQMLVFTNMTHLLVYNRFTKEMDTYEIPKDIEPEDFDFVGDELYCAVYRPKHQVEIHKVVEPQFVR